jgi:flagellar basal body rod protein FlgG
MVEAGIASNLRRQKELTMKGTRNTGFVVSLVALASLVGHFAIQRHFERQYRARPDSARHQRASSAKSVDVSAVGEFMQSGSAALIQPRDRLPQVIPASDVGETNDHDKSRRPPYPPAEVPSPADAGTFEDPSSERKDIVDESESAVRDVIEHELSHATREEREIWFDELKTLPAGVVRDLLQVRKQLRALPRVVGGNPEKLASADPLLMHHPQEVVAEPASQRIRFNLPDYVASSAALESAIAQLRHNLTNAATPGFKRFRVMMVDAYGYPANSASDFRESGSEQAGVAGMQGDGCRNALLLLDVRQGALKKTSQQYDMAIEGEGFFVVREGEKEFLTRNGAFTLDRERRLCLAITNEVAVLQPPISIPETVREIVVSADGTVTVAGSDGGALTAIGRLQLARVASPSRLRPVGNTFFVANESSGAVVVGSPAVNGLGEIQQGYLERANVEFEREQEEIEELTTILKSLPVHNPRPATATTPNHSHKR